MSTEKITKREALYYIEKSFNDLITNTEKEPHEITKEDIRIIYKALVRILMIQKHLILDNWAIQMGNHCQADHGELCIPTCPGWYQPLPKGAEQSICSRTPKK